MYFGLVDHKSNEIVKVDGYHRVLGDEVQWRISPPQEEKDLFEFINVTPIRFPKMYFGWRSWDLRVAFYDQPDSPLPFHIMNTRVVNNMKVSGTVDINFKPGALQLAMSYLGHRDFVR